MTNLTKFETPPADELDFDELRQSSYTPERGAVFLAVLSIGATPLNTAASRIGVTARTVREWRARCPEFGRLVDIVISAREMGYNDNLHAIAQNDEHKDTASVNEWLLEKANPNVYGKRQRIDVAPANMTPELVHEALVEQFTEPSEAVVKALEKCVARADD